MKTRKTCRKFQGIAAFVLLSIASWAGPALADCPDYVSCRIPPPPPWDSNEKIEVGRINVSTCYKFGYGCRPWHCDGAPKTDREHWLNVCKKNLPKCKASKGCVARFPGAPIQ